MSSQLRSVQGQLAYIIEYCEHINIEIAKLERDNAELLSIIDNLQLQRQPIGDLSVYLIHCERRSECPTFISIIRNMNRLARGSVTYLNYCECHLVRRIPCCMVGCTNTRYAASHSIHRSLIMPTCMWHIEN